LRVRLRVAVLFLAAGLCAPAGQAQDALDPTAAARQLRAARPQDLAPRPSSSLDRDQGNLVILEHDGSSYDMFDGSGGVNLAPRAALARRFYETHGDNYDLLVVFTNFEFSSPGVLAFHTQIRNDTRGIGRPLIDVGALMGSPSRLKGFIDMAAVSRYRQQPASLDPSQPGFTYTLGVLAHELGHQWLSYVHHRDAAGNNSIDLLGRDDKHWSYLLDSDASFMYGSDWVASGPGRYTAHRVRDTYSSLDLYLMGLLDPARTPAVTLLRNPAVDRNGLPVEGATLAAVPETVTVSQVVASEGPRSPSSRDSQKDFRLGFIVLTAQGEEPSPDDLAAVERVRAAFADFFFFKTRGLATADTTLAETPEPPPAPVPDVERATAWLLSRQAADGRWEDSPATAVRDTAAALEALNPIPEAETAVARARAWLQAAPPPSLDHAARRAVGLATPSLPPPDRAALLATVLDEAGPEGGYGIAQGYAPDALDTALALRALSALQAPDATPASRAAAVLQGLRHPDGGFSVVPGGAASTVVTAETILALRQWPDLPAAQALVPAAVAALLGRRNPDGGFGESPSTPYATALALRALLSANAAAAAVNPPTAWLQGHQLEEGGWAGGVYPTALTIAALRESAGANLTVPQDGLQIEPPSATEGQVVSVGARVRNAGRTAAPAQHVRLYDGDPALGPQVGEATLGPLGPGQEGAVSFDFDTTGRPGQRTLYVVADAAGEVRETREDDNSGARGLAVAGLLPNLQVAAFDVAVVPNPPEDGETATVTVAVRNGGQRPSSPTLLDVTRGDPRFGGQLIGRTAVPALAPGQQALVPVPWNTSGQRGTHEVFVRADADFRLAEGDETDNEAAVPVTVTGPLPPGPDLELALLRGRPERLLAIPQEQVVEAVVRNLGRDPVTSVVALRDAGGTLLGQQPVSLAPRSSVVLGFTLLLEGPGTRTFAAAADPAGAVDETREDNNTATLVLVDGADTVDVELPAGGVVATPTDLREGDTLSVSALVRNRGTAPLLDVPIVLAHAGAQVPVELARQIVSLPPGTSTTLTFAWSASVLGEAVPLAVLADPFQVLDELSESNNRRDFTVRVQPSALPNLRVSGADLHFQPDPPLEGGEAEVSVAVRNTGTVAAGPFTVRFFRGDPGAGGTVVGEAVVNALAGGAAATASVTWAPVDTRGITGVFALADANGAVAEYDETDNRAFRPVSVHALPDLVLTTGDVALTPGFPRAGEPIAVTARVRNLGQQPAPATVLRAWEGEPGSGTLIGEATVAALAPLEVAEVPLAWTPAVPPGEVALSVVADAAATVREADEGNNVARRLVVIQDADLYLTEPAFSPNGDGVKDTTTLAWRATVEVDVVVSNSQGARVRTLAEHAPAQGSVAWDGRDARGRLLWDGVYTLSLEGPDHFLLGRTEVVLDTNRSPIHDAASTGLVSVRNLTCSLPGVLGPAWTPAEDEALFVVPASTPQAAAGLIRVAADGQWSYVGGAPDAWYEQVPGEPDTARVFVSVAAVSPDGREALLTDGAGGLVAADLRTGARRPIGGAGATRASWSPDARRISLGNRVVDREGVQEWSLPFQAFEWSPDGELLTDGQRVVRHDGSGESALPLPVSDQVEQVQWLADGRLFVRTAPNLGLDGDDPRRAHGFLLDPDTDAVTELPWIPRVPAAARLAFTPNGARAAYPEGTHATVVREDGSDLRLADLGPSGTGFAVSPHGRVASFTASGSGSCNGPGADTFVLANLQNMTLDLQLARLPANNGVLARGTASDRALEFHRLDYAASGAPEVWHPIGPSSAVPVTDDVLAVWVPPAPGTYLVRLSALDRAGNAAATTRVVTWDRVPALANVAQSERLISPTGDGVKDSVRFSYLVVEPTRVDVAISGPVTAGQPAPVVRRLALEHPAPGPFAFDWDGRDEAGGVARDGRYTVSVNGLPFSVDVDSTPPDLAWAYRDLRSEPARTPPPAPGRVVADRHWHVVDPHLAGWVHRSTFFVQQGEGQVYEPERDAQGDVVYVEGRPKVKYDGTRAADTVLKDTEVQDAATDPAAVLTAVDHAGNRSTIPVAPVAERLFLLAAATEADGGAIGLPLGGGPYALDGAVAFSLGETLRATPPNAPAALRFEHRPAGGLEWTAAPPFNGRGWGVDFGQLGLSPAITYQGRFQGQGQATATSETFSFVLCDVRATLSVDASPVPGSGLARLTVRVSGPPPPDPFSRVLLRARGPDAFSVDVAMDRQPDGSFLKTIVGPAPRCGSGRWTFAAVIEGESGRRYLDQKPCRNLLVGLPQSCTSSSIWQEFPFCAADPGQAYLGLDLHDVPDGMFTLEAQGAAVGAFEVRSGHAPPRVAIDAAALSEGRVATLARRQGGPVLQVVGPAQDSDVRVEPGVPEGPPPFIDRTPAAVSVVTPPDMGRLCIASDDGAEVARLGLSITELGREMELGDAAFQAGDGPWRPLEVAVSPRPVHIPSGPSVLPWKVTGVPDGTYSVRLPVCDRAGHRTEVQRRLTLSRAAVPVALALSRSPFSPNGDGRAEESVATVTLTQAARLTVEVHDAAASLVRRLVTDQAYEPGPHLFAWDGRTDDGQPAGDGRYTLVVSSRDACDIVGRSQATVEVDTQAPAVAIAQPTPGQPVAVGVDVRGRAEDAHLRSFELAVGAGSAPVEWAAFASGTTGVSGPAGFLGRWNVPGTEGPHVLRLQATDRAENTSTVFVPVEVAAATVLERFTVAPAFSPNGDGQAEGASIEYVLRAAATVTLTVRDGQQAVVRTLVPALVDPAGTHAITWDGKTDGGVPAPEGGYSVHIHAEAPPTPAQESSAAVVLDRSAPLASVTAPLAGGVVAAGAVVRGTVSDPHLAFFTVTVRAGAAAAVEIGRGSSDVVDGELALIPALADGPYMLAVSGEDVAGNRSLVETPISADTQVPVARLTSPGPFVARGTTPIAISGTATDANLRELVLEFGPGEEPAAFVEIARGSTAVTGGVLGHWPVASLPDGPYSLRLTVTDRAGQSAGARVMVTLDGTAPRASLVSPAPGALLNAEVSVRGTAGDAYLERWTVEMAPGTAEEAHQWTPLASGTEAVEDAALGAIAPLPPDGVHSVRLTVRDAARNGAAATRTFTVDTLPPGAVGALRAEPLRGGSGVDVRLDWTAAAGSDVAGYVVERDDVPLTPQPIPGTTFLDGGPGEGTYRYSVHAVDRAGNAGTAAEATLRLDLTPPLAAIDRPAAGQAVSGSVDVRGTALGADFAEYRLLVGAGAQPTAWTVLKRSSLPVAAGMLGSWTAVGAGPHVLALEAEDTSGNVARAAVTVTVDNVAPAAPVLGSVALQPDADALAATWQASPDDDVDGYLVYRDGRLANATGVVVGDLRPYLVPAPVYVDTGLPDGERCYRIVAMDHAGNLSPPSNTLCRTLDNRRPHAVIVAPADATRFEFPLRVLADTSDTDVAAVQFELKPHAQSQWEALGSADTQRPFETTLDPATLAPGAYDLRARARDAAGEDPEPAPITVTYGDTTAPAPPRGLGARVDGLTVHLAWTASSEPDLAGYHVWRGEDRLTSTPVTGTSYVDTVAAIGSFVYHLTAHDTDGNESGRSGPATARVYQLALEPDFPTADGSVIALPGRGALAGTTIEIRREGTVVASVVVTSEGPFAVPAVPLAPGGNLLTARGVDADGNRSVDSLEAVLIANERPGAVDGLEASVSGHTVDLAWSPVAEEDLFGYAVRRGAHDLTPVVAQTTAASIAASSTAGPGFEPALAFDGNPATAWFAGPNDPAATWTVTFPEAVLVHRVRLTFPVPVDDYRVEVAWQGRFLPVARVRGNSSPAVEHVLPAPFATDALRLVLEAPQPGLSEVAVDRLAVVRAPTAAFRDEAVPDGIHEYEVRAADTFGAQGAPGLRSVAVGDVMPPAAPTGMTAMVEGSDVLLSWTASPEGDVTHYVVLRDGVEIATTLTAQYPDPSLPNGTYSYSVRAVDAAGNRSPASAPVLATIAMAAPPPPVLAATALGNGAVRLGWTHAGAARFAVLSSAAEGGPYAPLAQTGDTRSFIDGTAQPGQARYYVAQAADARGTLSAPSNVAAATPQRTAPPAPPILLRPTDPDHPLPWPDTSTWLDGRAQPGSLVSVLVGGGLRTVTEAGPPFQPAATETLGEATASIVAAFDARHLAYSTASAPDVVLWRDLEGMSGGAITHSGAVALRALAFAPDARRLAYGARLCADQACREGLFAVDLETGEAVAIDDGGGDVTAADWSRDGTSVAYTTTASGGCGIWVRRLDGSAARRLAGAAECGWPRWSPDGTRLAVAARPEGAASVELWMVDVVEGGGATLAAGVWPRTSPSWSPDGGRIAYTAKAAAALRARTVDVGTGQRLDLGDPSLSTFDPQFDPEGGWLSLATVRATAAGPERVLLAESLEDGRRVEVGAAPGDQPWPLHAWMSQRTLALALPGRAVFFGAEGSFHLDALRLGPGSNAISALATDPDEGLTSEPSRPIVLTVAPERFADLAIAPDLLSTYPDIPGAGQDTLVKARVDNRGPSAASGVHVLMTMKDASGVEHLSREAEITLLPAGSSAWISAFWTPAEAGTYALRAQADPADAIAELREDDNEATRGVLVAPQAGLLVSVSSDRAAYEANTPVLLTVRVTNAGPDLAGTLATTVEDEGGQAALVDTRSLALGYGQSTTLSLAWNTGTTYAGPYTFLARATGAGGSGEGSQAFRILPDVRVEARLLPLQATVLEGQPAAFTVRVSNRSVNAALEGTTARLDLTPLGAPPVFTVSAPVPAVLPGGTWEGALVWPAARPAGEYVATVAVLDDATALATASAPLQVRGTAPLAGTLATSAHVVAGLPIEVHTSVTNTGAAALSAEPFEVALMDGASGEVLRSTSFTLDLAAGERREASVTLTGGAIAAGAYPVFLRATRFALTLDRATVHLHGPLTAPSLDSPAPGARVDTPHPLLVVLNAGGPPGSRPTYEFQLFADAALTQPLPGASGVAEAPVRTGWRVGVNLGEDRTYYWRARAADVVALSPWTAVGSFTVDAVNQAPGAPLPESPEPGDRVATLQPALVVKNARDPERDTLRYDFRVAEDAAMSTVVASAADLAEGAGLTSWTLPVPLAEDRTYFWTARARDAAQASPWSQPSAFTVDASNLSPDAPQPRRPIGGASVTALQPEVVVGNASDPEGDALRYRFEVDVVPSFDSTQLQVSPPRPEAPGETAWTPPLPLPDNTLHYWRAAANDGRTTGAFAGSTFFVNVANDAPSSPVALSPTTGMVVGTATPALRLRNAVDLDRDPLTYEFEVTDDGGATVLASAAGVPAGAAETEWTVAPALPENVHARWRARAQDGSTTGPWSEPQSFRVNAVAEPPTPPTLQAPAEAAVLDTTRPALTVHNASSPDEQPLTYTFELNSVDGDGNETLVAREDGVPEGPAQTSWTPSQDLPDGRYRWRARAVDPVQPGPWMDTASFTVLVDRPPQPPAALQAVAGDAQVQLGWEAVPEPDVVAYRVLRATASGGPYTPVATVDVPAFTDTGLANGVTVFYVVTALDARFESAHSGEVAATPRPAILAAEVHVAPGSLPSECLLGGACAGGCTPWLHTAIELPYGLPPDAIDRSTIRLGGTLAPDPGYAQVVDRDGDGQPELEQRFPLAGLAALLHTGPNALVLSGRADGSDFRGQVLLDVAPLRTVLEVSPRLLKKTEPNPGPRFVARLALDACVNAAEVEPQSVRLNGTVAPLLVNAEGGPMLGVRFKLSAVVDVLPAGEAVEVRITGALRSVTFAGTAVVHVLP
jgi:subtilase family serine protease/flagellar hook assembly protein FlgD